MSTLNRFRFRATKPHWQHAWVTIGLVAIIACFVAIADGIRSLSVVIVYGIGLTVWFFYSTYWG